MREEGGLKLKLFEAALEAAKSKRETGKVSLKYKILDKIVLKKIRARLEDAWKMPSPAALP